ncbi:peptidase E [Haliscomenobacter hydrossis]|uniref:Peptidase S51 dipeptidase E n=1 Tax=Haliscomenobacter hydrossis (strain ATCC 27775 / DSM 1100 / LMG 10767 / O) TaxID=760192 RepID=F4KZE7_HALH1|nr:peptidase E [Haliscomenobacter hydrossis]AEE48442.1 peptidase S51 dipeptidase E [Haliscomenobacter hydrossis DSM 1100]
MKLMVTTLILSLFVSTATFGQEAVKNVDKTIFVYGGDFNKVFINYVIGLTKKPNPKILFIPTGAADNANYINNWYSNCAELPLIPYVLRTFINSSPTQKTFEEQILECDAIIVGGGNTLNMLAIWKAQGIDTVLRKAYERGIILAGGSAGSLCWFMGGSTDSRPKELTFVEGLSFLNYSHSPHYHKEAARRPLYHNAILTGKLKSGYACDDKAGLLFINGVVTKSVSQNIDNNNYFVSVIAGKIKEELLSAEIIKE